MTGVRYIATSAAVFHTEFGTFELRAYGFDSGAEHLALLGASAKGAPLVRLQSACMTGTAFHALMCDCRQQLEQSLSIVAREGGCVVYLDQEGRGHGLVEKVGQLGEIAKGANTFEAAHIRRVDPDIRNYRDAAEILSGLYGSQPVRLLTNNPEKVARAIAVGITVKERLPIEPDPTDANRAYLVVKKRFMGHFLAKV